MLDFSYDPAIDTATIEGIKYSGQFFRDLGSFLPEGQLFRVEKRADGNVWIRKEDPNKEAETVPAPKDFASVAAFGDRVYTVEPWPTLEGIRDVRSNEVILPGDLEILTGIFVGTSGHPEFPYCAVFEGAATVRHIGVGRLFGSPLAAVHAAQAEIMGTLESLQPLRDRLWQLKGEVSAQE